MPSRWTTDVPGFLFDSPQPGMTVLTGMTTLINAISERVDPNVKNGAQLYTEKELSDANFIVQEFIDKCNQCFGLYLNLNKVNGDSVTGTAHTWNKSHTSSADADGFVEMGIYNNADYSFFSNFKQDGFLLSENFFLQAYEIIELLKWRIGEKGRSKSITLNGSTSASNAIQSLVNTYTSIYNGTYPNWNGYDEQIYRSGSAGWSDFYHRFQYQNYPSDQRISYRFDTLIYNQSRNYLGHNGFESGLSPKCVFNSERLSQSDVFNGFGTGYLDNKLNIVTANERADFYSLAFMADVTPATYEAEVSAIPFDPNRSTLSLNSFQMFFDIDKDTILEYYTP